MDHEEGAEKKKVRYVSRQKQKKPKPQTADSEGDQSESYKKGCTYMCAMNRVVHMCSSRPLKLEWLEVTTEHQI